MFYVTSEIYLNNDLGSLAVSVDNYPQKRKNHLTITYILFMHKPLLALSILFNHFLTGIRCCILLYPGVNHQSILIDGDDRKSQDLLGYGKPSCLCGV